MNGMTDDRTERAVLKTVGHRFAKRLETAHLVKSTLGGQGLCSIRWREVIVIIEPPGHPSLSPLFLTFLDPLNNGIPQPLQSRDNSKPGFVLTAYGWRTAAEAGVLGPYAMGDPQKAGWMLSRLPPQILGHCAFVRSASAQDLRVTGLDS